jgi:trehalose 6-phosphate phosphatase
VTDARAALALLDPRAFLGRPCLVVSDFDGTISRIGLDPWGASPEPLAQRALRRLAGIPGVEVVLLSGRTAEDLARRVRVGGARYLGNHGLEHGQLPRRARAESLRVVADSSHDGHLAASQALAVAVPLEIGEPWLIVEPKYPAVTFWYRGAPDVPDAARRVRMVVDRLDPDGEFERFPGKRCLELRPPGATQKRDAVAWLLRERRPATAILIGDDVSDALAFAVLRGAREGGALDGLAVGVHALHEVPQQIVETADAVLDSPVETARFLAGLERALRAGQRTQRAGTGPRSAAQGA